MTNYARFYDLESYLFSEVSETYKKNKQISAFDFFCIVIWKANRSKSRVARRLLAQGHSDLELAVAALTTSITNTQSNKERMRVLIERWGFRLPMASAILTVLFPDDFAVYDVRVCDVFGDFKDAQYKTRYEELWGRYSAYVARVRQSVPEAPSLREKDRYLWGQSFATQLRSDIESKFGNAPNDTEFEA